MKHAPLEVTLRQLQYVVTVADARSFRRAAALCGVSQPSLSAQVAEVEAALGVQLFERDPRSVLVTAAGEELVQRARAVLMGAEDLVEAARRSNPLAGTLRLGVIPTIGPYLLPDLDPALRRTFPGLTLRWTEDKTHVLVDAIGRGELDAAVLALEAELGDLTHEVIARDPFVLATPPGHPLCAGPVCGRDLRGETVLLLDDGHCFREQALSLCASAGARELGFRATSLATLAQMVAGGAGVTLLPRMAVEVENRRGRLAITPLTDAPGRTVVLAWRPRSALGAALARVAAAAREELGSR
ncbi:MAG: putative hydrogen peroxide-inducible genes activator [Myxococcales bacterium]